MTFLSSLTSRLFSSHIDRLVSARLSSLVTDDTFLIGGHSLNQPDRDRFDYDRETFLQQSLDAWRLNPLARRLVGLTSQYVVGDGISVTCKHQPTADFLSAFWSHPLNRMDSRVYEWCDELTRTGNLFILISTDSSGFSYVRACPATGIESIDHRPNDVEQPVLFHLKPTYEELDPSPLPAYDRTHDLFHQGAFKTVMLHYTVNRPVGAQWGESDLAPVLKWLSRYANWLEDRARLNRYRTSFLYVLKGRFNSEAERRARQQVINASPPSPGSILVSDESESWEVIEPKLESTDANTDGLALKKMISAGAGVPLHFLAEPESSTRTTAEASGGPTYRHFEQRQKYFLFILKDILSIIVTRRSLVPSPLWGEGWGEGENSSGPVSPTADIIITGADISARDNVSLSLSATNSFNVFSSLRDRSLIDDHELLRAVYRFCGEPIDIEDMLARGAKAPPPIDYSLSPDILPADPDAPKPAAKAGRPNKKIEGAGGAGGTAGDRLPIDVDTGEPKQSL